MRIATASILTFFVVAGSFLFTTHRGVKNHQRHTDVSYDRSEALEALNFWTQSRAYPGRDIPAGNYMKAYQAVKLRMKEHREMINASAWISMGPTNVQGRCLCVAIHPYNSNILYLGTASGGLWQTTSQGANGDWHQVPLGYPALGISAILIDPVNPSIMYLGTGEVYNYQNATGGLVERTTRGSYGIGILKTTDGGTTWSKSLDWSFNQQRGIEMLKINPLNRHTIWTGTSEGIYKTQDDGATWQLVLATPMAEDIVINPQDTNKVIISIGNFGSAGSGIYHSTDGGVNWTVSADIPFYTGKTLLTESTINPNSVYANVEDSTTGVGGLWKSTNFGNSWVELSHFSSIYSESQGWYSHYVALHPQDSMIVIYNRVASNKSTDGGYTFTQTFSNYSDNHGYAIDPRNPNLMYTVNDNGIYRSTDFGSSYVNIGWGIRSSQFYNGFSCSESSSNLSMGHTQDHLSGMRYSGSLDWDLTSGDEVGWTAINPTNDSIMYFMFRYGIFIKRSTDRGGSWNILHTFDQSGAWNSPLCISHSDPRVLYFGDTKIHKTTDGGLTWMTTNSDGELDGNPALSMAVSASNSDIVYVGTGPRVTRSHVYRTMDGGAHWDDVSAGLPDRFPMDIAINPENSHIIYAAMGGFGSGHVFKSTNDGQNWTDVSGTLPDVPTTAIAIDPLHPFMMYVGNDLGVNISTDAGTSWSDLSTFLPDAVIAADLVVSPADRTLRLATHGNGVYRSHLVEPEGDYFDYKSLALLEPAPGVVDTIGNSHTIRATFKNIGSVVPIDSFSVQVRILHRSSEVFTSTQQIAPLGINEVRQVAFGGLFDVADTGSYIIETITHAPDQNVGNDTLRSTLHVYPPPTMRFFTSQKISSPYEEIATGLPGPTTNVPQLSVALPFSFRYDGQDYDSVQISTNGWVEFGTGATGSLLGLTPQEELASFSAPLFATESRPTKLLCPWCANLSTDAPGGQVTYNVTGTMPNRVLTIQWKNMKTIHYLDNNLLNFQVKLYEAHSTVEFAYGPIIAQGYQVGIQGAVICLKDYLGGDYRIYDLAKAKAEPMTDLRADLQPYADWPGEDSSYVVATNSFQNISVNAGWNLVSLPVLRTAQAPASFYPAFIAHSAYGYAGGYHETDSLKTGIGYWIKTSHAVAGVIVEGVLDSVTVHLHEKWNLIGAVDHEIAAPTGPGISSLTFGYSASSGYAPSFFLKPGMGYWVKSTSAHDILLGAGNAPKASANILPVATCQIVIADATGWKQTLLLAPDDERDNLNVGQYELPPVPPSPVFDARFRSQRMLEAYPVQSTQDIFFPIQLHSAVYPLTISYQVTGGQITSGMEKGFLLEEKLKDASSRIHALKGNGSFTIASPQSGDLRLKVTSAAGVPRQFSLGQNYPNPFNPMTHIAFALPVKSDIRLVMYDLLGREVRVIATGTYDADAYTVPVEMNGMASGVYFYKLTAGSFTQVKKMLLLR